MRTDGMELSDELRDQIRESLHALHPEKVIAFGYGRTADLSTGPSGGWTLKTADGAGWFVKGEVVLCSTACPSENFRSSMYDRYAEKLGEASGGQAG